MQNLNDGNNISDKELLPLIEYAKWELYNFNLLKNSKKLTELELILIDKDILRKWKEKSGYNKFKKQIFSYLFNLNKIKKQKEKINIEKENLSEKWKKLISEGVVNPNNIKSISKTDLSGFYLSLKENKINAYKDYEVISSKLFNIFSDFINYKIIVSGYYFKNKLIIPMNYKNQMSLRTSMKSGEYFMEIIYINDKNEIEDILAILPNDNNICNQIEEYYLNSSIDNLVKNIFINLDEKNNKFITEFIDNNENKTQYKLINKKYINFIQESNPIENKNNGDIINKNIIENKKGNELEKLKLILSQKIQILKDVNQRINERKKNINGIKSNLKDEKNLEKIKNIYLGKEKEYEMKQKELSIKKENLKNKEKILKDLIVKNNNNLKIKEKENEEKLRMSFPTEKIKSNIRLSLNDNYLIQEKKLKEKEEYLNNKQKEINLKETNIKKREVSILDQKKELLKKEKELNQKLLEINDKLIYLKNKAFLMNFKDVKDKENNELEEENLDNNDMKELKEIEEEFEKEINSQNLNTNTKNNKKPENKIKQIKIQNNLLNNYNTSLTETNSINPNQKRINTDRFNRSPDSNKLTRTNIIKPNNKNIKIKIENTNANTGRYSLNYNLSGTKTFNNNSNEPNRDINIKSKLNQKINQKVNQTETKINKNKASLGLEETERPKNINSVLQCLAHIPELAEGILELGYKEKYFKDNKNVELTRNFATIINNIFFPMKYGNTEKIFCPKNFVDIFLEKCPLINQKSPPLYFSMNEMLKFILDNFHDELNKKKQNNINENISLKEKNDIDLSDEKGVLVNFLKDFTNNNSSLISKLFFGLTKMQCICNKCGNTKYNFDSYNYLYFDLPKIKNYSMNNRFKRKFSAFLSINDCLDYLRRDINLTTSNKQINLDIFEKFGINQKSGKAFCEKCKNENKFTLNNSLYSANTILAMILERGDDDNYYLDDIQIPEELNLENYVEFNKSVKKYYLCGVVSNLWKNNTYGRFVSYCRMMYNGNWYCYNNEKIKLCMLKDVLKEGNPYMLIYHKI